MPSSTELFGGGQPPMNSEEAFQRLKGPMLPGIAGVGEDGKLPPSMFPRIVARNYGHEPDPEEFDKEMDRIRYDRLVKLKDMQVLTFDFSDEEDVKRYRKIFADLYPKMAAGAIVFHCHERMQINDATNPRWLLHMEYSEYELVKKDITEPSPPEQPEEKKDETGESGVSDGTA